MISAKRSDSSFPAELEFQERVIAKSRFQPPQFWKRALP
jgi:hypothetical protein